MKLTVYRQSSKTRPDGTVVYKGEDARPYVDDRALFVADGLGGAAAIRHQKIKAELFDPECIMDTLFNGVYDEYKNEQFVQYVTDSFYELFSVKDCYTENINNIKKSGYFASRIVTAIFLHELLYESEFNAHHLIECYNASETEEKKKEFLSELSEHMKERIQTNLRAVAKNANIVYESSYSGLALLGSTLCATLFLEGEDCVEALYFTAGDSRPYVWTEENGLQQVLEDQEGSDGGMTNYIKANDDADFDISCHYFKFVKPCILFNASDGCFDSGRFVSQLVFEKTVLDSLSANSTIEDAQKELTDFFVENGRHDDSSTIAMRIFGYDSFEVLKEAANRRLNTIQSEYLDEMPDLLDTDYSLEYEQCESELPERLKGIKERFEADEKVKEYCESLVKNAECPEYTEYIARIDAQIGEAREKLERIKKNISDVVAGNFERFIEQVKDCNGWRDKRVITKIRDLDEFYSQNSNDYVLKIEQYRENFDKTVMILNKLLEEIYNVGVPESFRDYDEIGLQTVEHCERAMNDLFEFFNELNHKKQGAVKRLTRLRTEYIENNIALANENLDKLNEIVKLLIDGELSTDSVALLSDDKNELDGELADYKSVVSDIDELQTTEKVKALDKAVKSYWEASYVDIIKRLISDETFNTSEDLLTEAKQVICELADKASELQIKVKAQSQLFAKYDIAYNKYIGGENK